MGAETKTPEIKTKKKRSQTIGAVFLMAASAMGPGFLTQTAKFVGDFHESFGFVVIASLVLSIIVQVNVWRVLCVSGMRAQDVANKLAPGLGYFLALLVFLGGLVFNIGNVGGAALGLNALLGLDLRAGYLVACAIAITVFSLKNAQRAVDNIAKILSCLKIGIILVVLIFIVHPPVGEALKQTFVPSTGVPALFPAILTLVGGTVGGYITFAGAHRLIDGGIVGKENEKKIVHSAWGGLGVAGISRIILFLLVLGVVVKGASLDPTNPAADAFLKAGGEFCYRLFGLLLFAAGITSITGASYTSLSFVKSLSKTVMDHNKAVTIAFIACSTLIMLLLGQPAKLLVLAGALNALVLPLGLAICLIAAHRKDIVGEDYKHPLWLTITGTASALLFAYFAVVGLGSLFH
ncbi:5-oxoproline transporter [Ruminococcaceae bacterium BL-6]|nr:5-oxoproline transporter [Ruminococcaceae bacterium BL-6]